MMQTHELQWTSSVAVAREVLEQTGARAAIVYQCERPIGIVTGRALRGDNGREPRPDAMVADVMDLEVVPVHPSMGTHATLDAYTRAAWQSLKRRLPKADTTIARRNRAFLPGRQRRHAPRVPTS
jgi:hypothetical protein